MIKVFSKEEVKFDHNRTILTNVTNAVISEKGNGDFSLELSAPIDRAKDLTVGAIITAPTPRGIQPFRIYRAKKTLRTIDVKARHIFYDLANSFLLDCRPTKIAGQGALDHITANREKPTKFRLSSDVTTSATAYYIRKTELEALLGADNSFVNRWGGYLIRDGYNVHFRDQPLNRGYEIRLGKNLTGVDLVEDTSEVATVLLPTFVLEDNQVYMLPEKYVKSPLVNLYPEEIIRELRVELTEEQRKQEPEALYEYIRQEAARAFDEGRDKPKVSLRVKFVDLSKTESYKNLGLLTQLDIFDLISCHLPNFGIQVDVVMQAYSYDPIKERFLSMDLGTLRPTGASVQKQLQRSLEEQLVRDDSPILMKVNALRDKAFSTLTGVEGGHIVYKQDKNGKPYEILIMDTPNIATARSVIRLSQQGIGLSSSGVNGPFAIAMTAKDGLYADFIYGLKISSAMIDSDAIIARHIAANAVDSPQIAANAVKSVHLTSNSVLTRHLVAGSINAEKMNTQSLFSLHGTFTGDIRANSGYFRGNIEATNGKFGSLTVTGSRTGGSYYGGLVDSTGSVKSLSGSLNNMGGLVKNLGGSLKDILGTAKGLGGSVTNLTGSITSMGGSLKNTLGTHAGPTTGKHTGELQASRIGGKLDNCTGSIKVTNSTLSGSFNGTATTNNSSGLGGSLKATGGNHKGTVDSATGSIGRVRFLSSNAFLQFQAGVDVRGPFKAAKSNLEVNTAGMHINKVSATTVVCQYFSKSSDERLKEDIAPLDEALISAFYDIAMKQFKYRNSEKLGLGINATELLYKSKSPLKPYLLTADTNGYLAVDYLNLATVGLAAVQDLHKRLTKLEESYAN